MKIRYLIISLLVTLVSSSGFGQQSSSLKIGLIADPQYADQDARGNRFYRNSLAKLDTATAAINAEQVDFTVTLGDLVDVGPKDLDPVLLHLSKLNSPVYNILGNHDYVNVEDGAALYKAFKMPEPYYTIKNGQWFFILLNTNELAEYATTIGSKERQSWEALRNKQKADKRTNTATYNGGISAKQLKWLESELEKAKKLSYNVIIFTHHPLFPENGLEALNNRDMLAVIEKYSKVKAVISGHHHPGNFATYKGIPMITLEGMVETSDQNAYGILELGTNYLQIDGKGRMTSRRIDF